MQICKLILTLWHKPKLNKIMQCHEIDYKIIGHDIQMVEVELDPNETVIAEAGTMLYMEDGIDFQTKMGERRRSEGPRNGQSANGGRAADRPE